MAACLALVHSGAAKGREEVWFESRIDHFDMESTATFKQRCLVDASAVTRAAGSDEHDAHAAAVFFYTGNEGPIDEFAQSAGLLDEIAPRFNALVVFCEHRYARAEHTRAHKAAALNARPVMLIAAPAGRCALPCPVNLRPLSLLTAPHLQIGSSLLIYARAPDLPCPLSLALPTGPCRASGPYVCESSYYGKSLPYGPGTQGSFSRERIGKLSVEQALADYAMVSQPTTLPTPPVAALQCSHCSGRTAVSALQ
jgi:hypothetical protein